MGPHRIRVRLLGRQVTPTRCPRFRIGSFGNGEVKRRLRLVLEATRLSPAGPP